MTSIPSWKVITGVRKLVWNALQYNYARRERLSAHTAGYSSQPYMAGQDGSIGDVLVEQGLLDKDIEDLGDGMRHILCLH